MFCAVMGVHANPRWMVPLRVSLVLALWVARDCVGCAEPVHAHAHVPVQQAWSYIVSVDATSNVASATPRGNLSAVPPGEPAAVLNALVHALPRSGGTIFLTAGKYVLGSTVVIDRSSVEIRGENMGGDLFFSSDSFYNGLSNKTAVEVVADGFDAFRVGDGTMCRAQNASHCLVLGTSFADLGISGMDSDACIREDNFTAGAGIRIVKADTIRVENVDIRRKEFGLKVGQDPSPLPFEYDHVIDVFTANNIYLAFNQYGLFSEGWVSNVRIRNIFGYINERSLIHADTKYDWLIDGVMSQSDGNDGQQATDAPVYISTRQDVTIKHVTIAANIADDKAHPSVPPIPLMYFDLLLAQDASGEWYRGHIKADTLTLFGTNSDAIFVTGTGFLDIHNIHAGSTHCMHGRQWGLPPSAACAGEPVSPENPYGPGGQSFYGGPGIIGGFCVNAAGPDTDVHLSGGFCNSNLTTHAGRARAMHNLTRVSGVRGFNPVGVVAAAFDDAGGFISPSGTASSPSPGKTYTVRGTDALVSVSLGTGVVVTITDAQGNLFYQKSIDSPGAELPPTLLPIGWSIAFGKFVSPPRVLVGGS